MGNKCIQMCIKTDFFQRLVSEYGQDFLKLILAQKSKQVLQQKFKEVMAKFRQCVTIFQNKINSEVGQNCQKLIEKFQQLKNKVDRVIPGGIAHLQNKKGSSINQFSGFNRMINKVYSIRDQTLLKVQQQKRNIQNQLQQKRNVMYNKIQQKRPKVPLYQKLSDQTRFKVLAKAQDKFKDKIQQNRKKLQKNQGQDFNSSLSEMDTFFNKIDPDNSLKDFVEISLKEMVKDIFGQGLGAKINRLADKLC